MGREEEIIKEREKKIEDLKRQKINPYAYSFNKKNLIGNCLKARIGDKVKTAGRIMSNRNIGKITFSDLQDFTGRIQFVLHAGETNKKDFEFFNKYFDVGDIIGVEGRIFKTKTGQQSILVKNLKLLTKSVLPLPDKWHGLQDKEERYRKRYLDLIMNPEIRKVFMKREKIIELIRDFMKSNCFDEVETPILQPIYGGKNAKPFKSRLNALNMMVFMRISNEMYLKRLIIGGYERIFEFSRDFRNEGIGKAHNPEFLIVETMWAYADYKDNMKFAEDMISHVVKNVHGKIKIKIQGKEIDFKTPWRRIKLIDIIREETGIDFSKISNFEEGKKIAKNIKVGVSRCENLGEIIIKVFEKKVQIKLIRPTFIYNYPSEAEELAKNSEKNKNFADSFKIVINGVEIGHSYCEQNDPHVLENYWKFSEKKAKGGDEEAQKMDEDFINALKIGMPPTSGLGVGIDRLAILLTDSPSIRDVILFPFMKPESDK